LFHVDLTHTPGAAMVWSASSVSAGVSTVVQLLNEANLSSVSPPQTVTESPPGLPSKSAIAVTVSTWSKDAGTSFAKLMLLLPAATA